MKKCKATKWTAQRGSGRVFLEPRMQIRQTAAGNETRPRSLPSSENPQTCEENN